MRLEPIGSGPGGGLLPGAGPGPGLSAIDYLPRRLALGMRGVPRRAHTLSKRSERREAMTLAPALRADLEPRSAVSAP
jgi:hypothetical protein